MSVAVLNIEIKVFKGKNHTENKMSLNSDFVCFIGVVAIVRLS